MMVLYECQMMLMVTVMEGECLIDLCLPNLLQNFNYSTTCSIPTPMNGKISKWMGVEFDESLPVALPP